MDGGRSGARELLIDDVAREMSEVGALTARQHRAGTDLFDDGTHAGIARRQRGLRLVETRAGERDGAIHALHYIVEENMMCALGVPGSISHGFVSDGVVLSPVEAAVAKGTYTTKSARPFFTLLVAAS